MTSPVGPLGVLVVGWFPAVDDPIAGRFVADQAAALLATGRVHPSVVSFEPFPLQGDLALREAAAGIWRVAVGRAVRDGRAFSARGAAGPAGVPLLRLGSPLGGLRGIRRTHQAIHRGTSLSAVLDASPGRWALVHAHVGYPDGAGAALAAGRAGIPFVLTEHATYLDRLFADPEVRASYLETARAAARIVVVSDVLAARLEREFPELASKLVVIPNAVDVDAFTPVGPGDRDPDELLWVGYRQEAKGTGILLRAFAIVHRARPATRLRMVGSSAADTDDDTWRSLADELGVAASVTFEPPADRAAVAAAMERAALFVHPSLRETFGIVAVEALAAGLPVVAADSGGVTEVLGPDPRRYGAIVPGSDAEALAAAILETLERRVALDPRALRAHVVERFGAAGVARRLADLYATVLSERWAGATAAAGSAGPVDRRPTGRPPRPVVVIAVDRAALDAHVAAFPGWVLAASVLVTTGPPVTGFPDAVVVPERVASDVAALLALQGRAFRRGPVGLVVAPVRWLRRALQRRRLLARTLPALTGAVAAAIDRAGKAHGDGSVTLVCLGGIDLVAAAPLVSASVDIAPGGLRWLGDLRAAEGEREGRQPAEPSSS